MKYINDDLYVKFYVSIFISTMALQEKNTINKYPKMEQ